MTTFVRWCKFNLVGAIGMVVQLTALAVLNRWFGGRYLWASAVAIELTLLHNFVWHRCFTWRERRDEASLARQLARFHLSNGLVSMAGNLLLMHALVKGLRMPVLVANIVAIACCGLVNFWLGHLWTFSGKRTAVNATGVRTYLSRLVTFGLLIMVTATAVWAQTDAETRPMSSSVQADAPVPVSKVVTHAEPTSNGSYLYNAGFLCGSGASTSSGGTKPTFGCGAGITLVPLPLFVEVGVMGPQANRSYLSGYLSVDGNIPLAPSSARYLPIAIVGYTRLFETGHALDYGLALALPRFGKRRENGTSLRIEVRDYWTFANPAQHNVMLRVGWMSEVAD